MMKMQKYWGVEEELPEEIIEKILLKMPVKELIRFSAVCKSWNSLIKNPRFIQTQLKNQTDDGDSELLLLLSSSQSDDLHWDNPAALFGHYSNLLNPIDNHNESSSTNPFSYGVVGTCNGLVCLSLPSGYGDPCPPVLRVLRESCWGPTIEVEVWSLARGGAWKSLNDNVPAGFSPFTNHHAFVKGAFHWVQRSPSETNRGEQFTISIVALDMVDELFRNVEIRQGRRHWPPRITKYHGYGDQCCLALFEFQGYSSFDLWVMKEYSVVESWTKLFNVCLLRSPEEEPHIEPFGITKSGQVVVRFDDGSLKWFDPKDKLLKGFGNQGYEYDFMDSFVESLALLGETNVVSY